MEAVLPSSEVNKKLFRITLSIACLTSLYQIVGKSLLISTGHIDGVYQTYNVLHRLSIGELPGMDFYPYLGLGPTFSLYPLFAVFGATVFSSQLSAIAVTNFTVFLTIFTLLRFSPLWYRGWLLTVIVSLFIYAVMSSKILPGNSLVAVRAFVVILAIWASYYFLITARRPILFGLSMGVVMLWSNDYGIPAFISMLFLSLIINIKSESVKNVFVSVVAAIICAFTLLLIITQANIGNFLSFSRGVSDDQFWYFAPYLPESNFYGLADIGLFWKHKGYLIKSIVILTAPLLLIFVLIDALRYRGTNAYILLLAGMSSIGGGLLPEIAGHKSPHYYYMLYAVYPFMLLLLIQRYSDTKSPAADVFANVGNYAGQFVSNKVNYILVILLIYCVIGIALVSHKIFKIADRGLYVESLGGYVIEEGVQLVAVSEKIKRLARSQENIMFQEYAGIPGVILGVDSVSHVDSVIHALGEESREQYYLDLFNGNYEFVTTTNPEYSEFQNWSFFQNWRLYRYLATGYRPAFITKQLIFWKKGDDEINRRPGSKDIRCELHQVSDEEVLITVSSAYKENLLAEIVFDIEFDFMAGAIPIIGNNRMIRVSSEIMSDVFQKTNTLPYYTDSASLPVVFDNVATVSLIMNSDPRSRSRIKLSNCVTRAISDDEAIITSLYKK